MNECDNVEECGNVMLSVACIHNVIIAHVLFYRRELVGGMHNKGGREAM